MRRLSVLLLLVVMLTACGTDYNINGTYVSENGNKDFSVVVCDDICMIEVMSTNASGETATVIVDGKVSKDSDVVVLTIDKDKQISGNQFEFLYSERFKTLTNTSDGKVLKKEKLKAVSPSGSYSALHDGKIYAVEFYDGECSLTITPADNPEQYVSAEYNGSFKVKENIITLDFGDSNIDAELKKFIYEPDLDVIMNTADGHIFERTEEN